MAFFGNIADELRRTAFFTACIDFARRTLPAPALVWLRSQMVRNLKGGPREVFTEIYRRNIWGYQETASGGGSTLHYTQRVRQSLPVLIGDLDIHTLLDLPCGDFHWMSEIQLPIKHYIGCDIVPILVQSTRIRYGRPDREFRTVDLCQDPLPKADLLLCRDCLMHLSEEMIFRALANIVRSDIRYLHDVPGGEKPLDPRRRLVHGQSLRAAVQPSRAAAGNRRLGATIRPASPGALGDRESAARGPRRKREACAA